MCFCARTNAHSFSIGKKIVRSFSDLRNCAYYIHCITHTEQTLLRMRIQWPVSLEISRCFKLKNLRVFVIHCYTHVTQLYFLFLMYSCPSSIFFYLLFYSILFISSFFLIFYHPLEFFNPPPLEKYHDVYQIIGYSWVWYAFSTHFWHLQTPPNKGFISYLSAFTMFYILHYSHSFYINYKDL